MSIPSTHTWKTLGHQHTITHRELWFHPSLYAPILCCSSASGTFAIANISCENFERILVAILEVALVVFIFGVEFSLVRAIVPYSSVAMDTVAYVTAI